jgi:hypothetical protein
MEGVKIGRRVFLGFERRRVQGHGDSRFKRGRVFDNCNGRNIQGDAGLHQHPGCFGGIHRLATAVILICGCTRRCATALHDLLVRRISGHAVRKLQKHYGPNQQ